jgi:energy-coupling factor transporter transmembrane protein EcfT
VIISQLTLGHIISKKKGQTFWLKSNGQFLLTTLLISTVINTLFAHTGSSVIFSLPENWVLVGGPITLESLAFGLINGLVIGSIYLAFNILNLALSIKQMTRLIPTALKPIAMTTTVAITFFPSIQQRAREIKEAQIIRGNPMKRVADWLPLIIPLLVTSLEKAFLLAESMTARGFHIRRETGTSQILLIGMVAGTFAIFSGWILRLYDYPIVISIILYVLGGLMIVFVFWYARRNVKTTRYHNETWTLIDILSSASFLLASIALFIIQWTSSLPSFSYSTYPKIQIPDFQWISFGLTLIPLLPAIFDNDD